MSHQHPRSHAFIRSQSFVQMTDAEVKERIVLLSKYGTCLNSVNQRWARRLCQAAKRFFLDEAIAFVEKHRDEPLSRWLGCDTTPLTTMQVHRGIFAGRRVVRKGKHQGDYCSLQVILQCASGECHIVPSEPTRLQDKSAWCHFSAYRLAFPLLRELGHRGIEIVYVNADRALFTAMVRKDKQLHHAYFMQRAVDDESAFLVRLKTWFVEAPCIFHDIMNGLKWGCKEYLEEPALLKDAYIALESVRQGMSVLWTALPMWLQDRLEFVDWYLCEEHRKLFWGMLTDDTDLQTELTMLQLRFDGGKMKVAAWCEFDASAAARVLSAVEKSWLVRQFTVTRWSSVLSSCQILLLLHFTGMNDLVSFCRDDPHISDYYVRGFMRCNQNVLRMAAVVGVSGVLTSSLCTMFLKDDRLPNMLGEVERSISESLSFVSMISLEVWGVLGQAAGMSGGELRHRCNSSAVTQAAFFRWRIRNALEPPWTLVQGDIRANVAELLQQDQPPEEETTRKVWELVQMGHNEHDIVDALRLMGNLPWSSKVTEEGHKGASSVMKLHKRLGEDQMRCRALLGTVRALVMPSKAELQLQRLRDRLQALGRRRPQNIHARHAYVSGLTSCARARKAGVPGSRQVRKMIFRKHGKQFQQLSADQKAIWRQRAEHMQEELRQELSTKRAAILTEIHAKEQIMKRRDGELPQLRLAACRLDQAQFRRFVEYANDPDFTDCRLQQLRDEACVPVGPPDIRRQAALDGIRVPVASSVRVGPRLSFLSWICRHRDFCEDCCFKFTTPDGDIILKFLFAQVIPSLAGFCRLVHAHAGVQVSGCVNDMMYPRDNKSWACMFKYDWHTVVFSDDDVIDESWPVHIMFDCMNIGAGWLGSDSIWRPLATVRNWFDVCSAAEEPEAEHAEEVAVVTGNDKDPFLDCPWLLDRDHWHHVGPHDVRDDPPEVAAQSGERQGEFDLDTSEELFEEVRAAMEAHRGKLNADGIVGVTDFRVFPRGGAWTLTSRGIVVDSWRAEASTADARAWCRLFSLQQSRTLSITRYQQHVALALANVWAHRMQFLFDVWVSSGKQNSCYEDPAVFQSYKEPSAARIVCADGSADAEAAVRSIVSLVPRLA